MSAKDQFDIQTILPMGGGKSEVAHRNRKGLFFDMITTNMKVTTRVNSGINDKRAEKLRWASVCPVGGFALYGVMFLMAAWQKTGP